VGVLRIFAREQVTSQVDDRQLAAAARSGDEAAFAELVKRHQGGVRRLAARILLDDEEARDIAQLAFIRAWENLPRYDPSWCFSTWLYRIASNLAIDALRARGSRERTHQSQLRLLSEASPPTAPEALQEKEVERIFRELAASLPPAQRQAFLLREVEGLATAEVAKIMGCSETTVRNHVFCARAALKRELAARFPEYLPRGGGR
jgi:RNA polymerase sigma-70 factor (ECF subfamily)